MKTAVHRGKYWRQQYANISLTIIPYAFGAICHTWLAFHLLVNQSSALQGISPSGGELITAAADGASGDGEHLTSPSVQSVWQKALPEAMAYSAQSEPRGAAS